MNLLLKSIKKSYANGFSLDIEELKFRQGQVYVVMGPNGSGKTALLNILGLLEEPDEGDVVLDDNLTPFKSNNITKIRHRIGFVMQDTFLFNHSVYYNVAYGLKLRKICRHDIEKRVELALCKMGITHLRDRNSRELSGGEKKRVSIAQVLVLDTEIILMDEPIAHVDKTTAGIIEKLIHDFRNGKEKTVVFTTHSADQAYRVSNDIITLKAGRVSDFIHENTFYGSIENYGNGIGMITPAGGVNIYLVSKPLESAHIAIDPENILLSKERIVSSARNSFCGVITKVEDMGVNVRVFVNCGVEFCSIVTKKSYTQFNFNIGERVYLNFKVNSVKVI